MCHVRGYKKRPGKAKLYVQGKKRSAVGWGRNGGVTADEHEASLGRIEML